MSVFFDLTFVRSRLDPETSLWCFVAEFGDTSYFQVWAACLHAFDCFVYVCRECAIHSSSSSFDSCVKPQACFFFFGMLLGRRNSSFDLLSFWAKVRVWVQGDRGRKVAMKKYLYCPFVSHHWCQIRARRKGFGCLKLQQ